MYIVIATDTQGNFDQKTVETFSNRAVALNSNNEVIKDANGTLTTSGGGNNFKSAGTVFVQNQSSGELKSIPDVGNVSTIAKDSSTNLIKNTSTKGGLFVEWRLMFNYEGDTNGTIHVSDTLPEGLDPVYARYFWLEANKNAYGDLIYDENSLPQMPAIAEYATSDDWVDIGLKGVKLNSTTTNAAPDMHAYYNKKTREIRFDITGLQKRKGTNLTAWNTKDSSGATDEGAADKKSVEVQLLTKVTDPDVLKGTEKKYTNNMTVTNDDGATLTKTSADATVKNQTITKEQYLGTSSGAVYTTENGQIPYSIKVNPNGLKLASGSDTTVTLQDRMISSLAFDPDSVKIYKGSPTIDDSGKVTAGEELPTDQYKIRVENIIPGTSDYGQNIYFTLPDETPLTIVYTAKMTTMGSSSGQSVSIGNQAYWFGQTEGTGDNKMANVSYASAATASIEHAPYIKVLKADQTNATKRLKDARFTLVKAKYDENTNKWVADDSAEAAEAVTNEQGIAEFQKDGNSEDLEFNQVYLLKEVAAPSSYLVDDTDHFVVVAERNSSGDVTDETRKLLEGYKTNANAKGQDFTISYDNDMTLTKPIYDKPSKTLTVRKEVTGNMADRDKNFGFTVTFNESAQNALGSANYTQAIKKDGWKFSNEDDKKLFINLSDAQTGLGNGGTASLTMPYGTEYTITETNNDGYITRYALKTEDNIAEADFTHDNTSTGKQTLTDDTWVTFDNDRDVTPPDSGIRTPGLIPAIIALGCFALMLTFAACKKRNDE